MTRTLAITLVAALAVVLGCGSSSETPPATTTDTVDAVAADTGAGADAVGETTPAPTDAAADAASPDAAAETSADAGAETEECPPDTTTYEGAPWALGAQIAPVGCVKLSFVLEVKGEMAAGKTLEWVRLRSLGKCGPSPTLAEVKGVTIAADGKATIVFKGLVIPADYSPTKTDVKIDLTMDGQVTGTELYCGKLGGFLELFQQDLAGSEFAAVPKAKAATPLQSSCSGKGCPVAIDHIDPAKCPTFKAGPGNAITSAGLARDATLFVPKAWDNAKGGPVVFLWHGIGDSPEEILTASKLDTLVDTGNFLLVVPRGRSTKDVPTQWAYVSDAESEDSYLFDDLLTCLDKQYKVDAKRVYSMGFSGGGMFTSWLASYRADKLAAVAVLSGGLIETLTYTKPAHKLPAIVFEGGAKDTAFETDLGKLAKQLMQIFAGNGQYVIGCSHTLGHEVPPEASAAAWALFGAVTLDTATPTFGATLPKEIPAYCAVIK
jgi:poly(3-hydroxybutyrate) depolymerase